MTLFEVLSYQNAKSLQTRYFIKLSLTNSDAFAEVCNEIQKVHQTFTYSFHPEMNNQDIFYGGKDFCLCTCPW